MAKISGFHTSLPKHKILGRVLNHFHTYKYYQILEYRGIYQQKIASRIIPKRIRGSPLNRGTYVAWFLFWSCFSHLFYVLCGLQGFTMFHHVSPWKPWITQYLDLIKFSVARQALIIEWSMIQIHNIRSSPVKKMVHLEMSYLQQWWFFRVKCHIASGHMHPPCHSHGLETAPRDHHRSVIFDQCGILNLHVYPMICGWWLTYPSEKWWSEFVSWGDGIPNWMDSHRIPWFQSPPTSNDMAVCQNLVPLLFTSK